MRRRYLAAAWIAGATVPLLLATVFVFGCCVLPFHQAVHKLMPLCETAADLMRGEHEHEHDAMPPAPAREKDQHGAKALSAEATAQKVAVSPALCPLRSALASTASHRSFISLGATRCDQDVGLHVLVETYRI